MRVTQQLWKQTLHPPKRVVPLASNPLTRWSRHLPQWRQLSASLTGVSVGLEGCHSAFNATNSIRTCLYFQTAAPPTFLTVSSWRGIEHVQVRSGTQLAPMEEMGAMALPPPISDSSLHKNSTLQRATPAASDANAADSDEDPFEGVAIFGEDAFFHNSKSALTQSDAASPIVAVENFTDRAQSVMQTRLPAAFRDGRVRLVVGHENWGVRRSLLRAKDANLDAGVAAAALPVADMVVYVPQYGTISSLNVVTSLGIALFYCYLDGNCPEARTIYHGSPLHALESTARDALDAKTCTNSHLSALRQQIQSYQDYFKTNLPTPSVPSPAREDDLSDVMSKSSAPSVSTTSSVDADVNTTPRIDRRPIHPVFYKKEMADIQDVQRRYRQALLQYSYATQDSAKTSSSVNHGRTPSFFGLSVLYENVFDQRNFGGLIRNANAFLVDHILYVGRRKFNVVGAVGSYHYTPPVYLGQLPSEDDDEDADTPNCDGLDEGVRDDATAEGSSWVVSLKTKVEALYKAGEATFSSAPQEWWLLDCGHGFLYEEDSSRSEAVTCGVEGPCMDAHSSRTSGGDAQTVSATSLQLYHSLIAAGKTHCLCDNETTLRDALAGGLVLLVPQEGKLPHPALMRLCTGVLTVLPDGVHHAVVSEADDTEVKRAEVKGGHRGLPSQVASGIALQRISAVLHPRLAAL